MAQALTVQAPSLCPTVSSIYHVVPGCLYILEWPT